MSNQNLKLVKRRVKIEGDDRDKLRVLFKKTLNGTIELNELKMTVAFLGAIVESIDSQIKDNKSI